MSAVNAIYHIVINTYRRQMTIPESSCDALYNYIAGIIRHHNCIVYAVNGIENHIHLLIQLHPSIPLADLVRDIKLGASNWIKRNQDSFPQFSGWGKEYGAFTYALRDREMVRKYIENQKVHHSHKSFDDEYRHLLYVAGVPWNDNRLT